MGGWKEIIVWLFVGLLGCVVPDPLWIKVVIVAGELVAGILRVGCKFRGKITEWWLRGRDQWNKPIREAREKIEQERKTREAIQSRDVNTRFVNAMPHDLVVDVPDGVAILRSIAGHSDSMFTSLHHMGTVKGVQIDALIPFGSIDGMVTDILRCCEGKNDPIVIAPRWFVDLLDSSKTLHLKLLKRMGIPRCDIDGRLEAIVCNRTSLGRSWKMDDEG